MPTNANGMIGTADATRMLSGSSSRCSQQMPQIRKTQLKETHRCFPNDPRHFWFAALCYLIIHLIDLSHVRPFCVTVQPPLTTDDQLTSKTQSARSVCRIGHNASGPRPGHRYKHNRSLSSEKSGPRCASAKTGAGAFRNKCPRRTTRRAARPRKSK